MRHRDGEGAPRLAAIRRLGIGHTRQVWRRVEFVREADRATDSAMRAALGEADFPVTPRQGAVPVRSLRLLAAASAVLVMAVPLSRHQPGTSGARQPEAMVGGPITTGNVRRAASGASSPAQGQPSVSTEAAAVQQPPLPPPQSLQSAVSKDIARPVMQTSPPQSVSALPLADAAPASETKADAPALTTPDSALPAAAQEILLNPAERVEDIAPSMQKAAAPPAPDSGLAGSPGDVLPAPPQGGASETGLVQDAMPQLPEPPGQAPARKTPPARRSQTAAQPAPDTTLNNPARIRSFFFGHDG